MRKQLLVLGTCVALIFGAMGCSDDDIVPLTPTAQAVLETTQAIVTGVNLVTTIVEAVEGLGGPGLETGDSEVTCNGLLLDLSKETCLNPESGTLAACTDPLFVNATYCAVEGIGVVSGNPDPAAQLEGNTVTLSLTIDGTTAISGTVSQIPDEKAGSCTEADYNITVENLITESKAIITGAIEGCTDGQIFGEPSVDLPDFFATFEYAFQGTSATIDVFEIGTLAGVCTVDPLNANPSCESV